MIRAVATVLLSAMLFQILLSASIIARYGLNQKVITEEFCVNKESPERNCHGSCHVSKQLRQQSPDMSEVPAELLEWTFVFMLCQAESTGSFIPQGESRKLYLTSALPVLSGMETGIFHPPRV